MYLVLLRLRYPLYCKQDIFIFYIQWLIFLLIGNTMRAASLAMKSNGSKMTCVVPSRYGVLSW
ncbi:hypothetical protein D2J89_26080 (plasmid) [Escherichia coli]|nr:hypothetical protein D2J89_26080 [Escherichia coli]